MGSPETVNIKDTFSLLVFVEVWRLLGDRAETTSSWQHCASCQLSSPASEILANALGIDLCLEEAVKDMRSPQVRSATGAVLHQPRAPWSKALLRLSTTACSS